MKKHLNTFPVPGQAPDQLEKEFARIEGPANSILARWQQTGARILESERESIAQYVAILYCRVTATEAMAQAMLDSYLKMNRVKRGLVLETPPKMAYVAALSLVEQSVNSLLTMKWQLLEAVSGAFILGDNPVTLASTKAAGQRLIRTSVTGLGHPDIDVALPVGPSVCLHCAFQRTGKDGRRHQVQAGVVSAINWRTILTAHHFVLSTDKSPAVAEMIRRRLDEIPDPDDTVLLDSLFGL